MLTDVANDLGHPPSWREMREIDEVPYPETYASRFGTWRAALEAAGFDIPIHRPQRADGRETPRYDRETLIELLQEAAAELGHPPTYREMGDLDDYPHSHTYETHFGSWMDALEAADLNPANREARSRMYDRETLIARLQEAADELGHPPPPTEINELDEYPTATTYRDRFGSCDAALDAAGLSTDEPFAGESGTEQTGLEEYL